MRSRVWVFPLLALLLGAMALAGLLETHRQFPHFAERDLAGQAALEAGQLAESAGCLRRSVTTTRPPKPRPGSL